MNNITTNERTIRVRFIDERTDGRTKRRVVVRTEMTLDVGTQTWAGERGAISALMLDDARLMIREGQTRGGVWPFDLVTFEVVA